MKYLKKSLLFCLLFFAFNLLNAQQIDGRLKDLEEEINFWIKKYNAVGLSVSVVENNQIVFSKGFGYRDLEKKLPINENTVFPIASCSKAFTASLLGILEGEKKLSLKNTPSTYIPNLKFYNSLMDEIITIEDLLSHKSGLGEINGTLVMFPEKDNLTVLEKLKHIKPEGKIKESSLYSNMGYTISGVIAEEVTNKSWESNIKNKLFLPLAMKNSFTNLNDMIATNNYALGYGVSKGKIEQVLYEEYYNYKAAGGIRSTSRDLANWMLVWLNNGKYNNKQIIPENYIQNARRHHNDRNNPYEDNNFMQGYGLGWRVEATDGEFKVYHGGNTSGFSTVVQTFPFKGLGITVLSNQQNSVLPYIIADIIKNRMLEKPKVAPENYPVQVSDLFKLEKANESLNKEKLPTHHLKAFEGIYSNKGYGNIEIKLENNKLYAIYPTYKFFLEHLNYNIFRMRKIKKISHFNPEFYPLNFRTNNKGEIDSFTVDFQSEPVLFRKK